MENWKKLIEKYSLSDLGRVRNDRTGQILKPFQKERKVMVTLNLMDKKIKQITIAKHVAKLFINEDVKKVVRKNKDLFDNRAENLTVY